MMQSRVKTRNNLKFEGANRLSDYLVKALAYEGFVRAYAVNATETIAEAQRRHDTWNTSSAALGRTMIGALMLGATLKGEDKMTVKVEGRGPQELSLLIAMVKVM